MREVGEDIATMLMVGVAESRFLRPTAAMTEYDDFEYNQTDITLVVSRL